MRLARVVCPLLVLLALAHPAMTGAWADTPAAKASTWTLTAVCDSSCTTTATETPSVCLAGGTSKAFCMLKEAVTMKKMSSWKVTSIMGVISISVSSGGRFFFWYGASSSSALIAGGLRCHHGWAIGEQRLDDVA